MSESEKSRERFRRRNSEDSNHCGTGLPDHMGMEDKMMNYDIEKAIKECEAKKTENEVIAYAVGVGRVLPMMGKRKEMKKAIDFIKKLDGFIGVYPVDLWHTLLIFDTLNNSKIGKNQLTTKGIQTGTYICPILIQKDYQTNKGAEE